MLIRDFNIAIYGDEKVGGKLLSIQQLQDFNSFIDNCSLGDIRNTGGKWS